MARYTRARDLEAIAFGRSNEAEGVSAHVDVGDSLLDSRHVAGDALIAAGARLMVRVRLHTGGARTVERTRAVAGQAQDGSGLNQIRIVRRAVHVVATEAGDPVGVHSALHEIVALHAVLMSCAVGKVSEGGF